MSLEYRVHLVILGNGIAGVTVARELRKRDASASITLVSGESDHHFSRPALMYVYLGHMRYPDIKPYEDHFWARNRITLRRGWVTQVDTASKRLIFAEGEPLAYDKLVLATGSQPNRFGWPGQDLRRVQGLYSLQDLVSLERCTAEVRHAVIVGGGLIGIELAEMLHSRRRHVTLLVREGSYWGNVLHAEEGALIGRAIAAAGIDLRLNTELAEVHDDGSGAVGAVSTRDGARIDCQLVGLAVGVHPNLSALTSSEINTARGVAVNPYFETSAPDVYAIGDCAEIHPDEGAPYVQQVWYSGRAQGERLAANLAGDRQPYTPGIWYNSAKFLDLEYQVYGDLPRQPTPGVTHRYWQHPDGDRSVRICDRDGVFIGLQALGVRYRHRVCEAWIAAKAPIAQVLDNLGEAAFDPEFSRRYESELRTTMREVKV